MKMHGALLRICLFGQVILRITDNVFDSKKIIERQLNSRGHKTKLLKFEDAIEFVMVLPGQTAMEVRQQFARIIRQYIAGERALIDGINANAASNSPLAQLARASAQEEDAVAVGVKRRREELELLKLEHEINTMIADNRVKDMNGIIAASLEIDRIRDPTRSNLDDRTRLMVQDALQNTILCTTQLVLSSGGQGVITNGPSLNAPISIGSVAEKLGYKPTTNDAKRIGADLKKRYVKLHNKPPSKHDQLCDGRVTLVNSYTEQDRPLVTEALHAFYARDDERGASD